jgi:hypothetical protein
MFYLVAALPRCVESFLFGSGYAGLGFRPAQTDRRESGVIMRATPTDLQTQILSGVLERMEIIYDFCQNVSSLNS